MRSCNHAKWDVKSYVGVKEQRMQHRVRVAGAEGGRLGRQAADRGCARAHSRRWRPVVGMQGKPYLYTALGEKKISTCLFSRIQRHGEL